MSSSPLCSPPTSHPLCQALRTIDRAVRDYVEECPFRGHAQVAGWPATSHRAGGGATSTASRAAGLLATALGVPPRFP